MVRARRAQAPAKRAVQERVAPRVPAKILTKLRTICLRLPEAYEEAAWVGTRWMIRKRNFAHVVKIEAGWPPAYARAASSDGPLVVVTFRTSDLLRDVLRDAGPRFFHAEWGTRWGTKVVGIKLAGEVNWSEVETLVLESYRLLAPSKLTVQLAQAATPRMPSR
jgi:predicted DNA-binding protein (MmcQ/YjbR family)